MARDRKAEAAKRDAGARSRGYSSYGQEYRAKKANYHEAAAYQAAVEQGKSGGMVKRGTRAGTVISVDWSDPKQRAALDRELKRYRGDRKAHFVIENERGQVVNLATKGGQRLDSFDFGNAEDDDYGDWLEEFYEDVAESSYADASGTPSVVTVTIA